MSIDNKNSNKPASERLGDFITHTFLANSNTVIIEESRIPRPSLTPFHELKQLKHLINESLLREDYSSFSEHMEALRQLAERPTGNLPAFSFFYTTCRTIHGEYKFNLFFGGHMPDDPEYLFNKSPEMMRAILKLTIKDFQFNEFTRSQEKRTIPLSVPIRTKLAGR